MNTIKIVKISNGFIVGQSITVSDDYQYLKSVEEVGKHIRKLVEENK